MNYKNKLIGLSLIALAAFSACTDEVENGGRPLLGDHSLSFAVSTGRMNSWTEANATRSASAPASQELEPVEMQGQVNGKAVYLQTEVTCGFPGDNQPTTRGTQIDKGEQDKIASFGVSAYTDKAGKPDYMYNEEATQNGGLWYPSEKYYWPTGKQLSFYAWYPYTATGMTLTDNTHSGAPVMTYAIPEMVADQIDVMTAQTADQTDPNGATSLNFDHALAAVKFAVCSLPNCIVRSITIEGVKHSGKYTLDTHQWNLDTDTKDFSVSWPNKQVGGTTNAPITADDETLFMMPQDLPSEARIVVEMNDGTKDFTVSSSIGGNNKTWERGHTYTYYISFNFISLIVSNETFVAYTDAALTNQPAFLLTASANDGLVGEIASQTAGVTVSPTSFSNNTNNAKVTVTWPKGVNEATVLVSASQGGVTKTKKVLLKRETPVADGPFWVYSPMETTSQSLGRDVLDIQNVSGADWIAFTTSATYSNDYSTDVLYNHSGSDIYLQTLSLPAADRFASLLAEKESENVMYCVEQKAITANYGFKGCNRTISREAEEWNIVLSGGRYKTDKTTLAGNLMISKKEKYGGGHYFNTRVQIVVDKKTAKGVSTTKYIKRRWDSNQNTDANNGARAVVPVVLQTGRFRDRDWQEVGGNGTMEDRNQWTYFSYYREWVVFSRWEVHSGTNRSIFNSVVTETYMNHWQVHQNHPYFGKTKWQIVRDSQNNSVKNTPSWYIWTVCCKNGQDNNRIHGHGIGGWANCIELIYWTLADYQNGNIYNNGANSDHENRWCYIQVTGTFASSFRQWKWETWNVSDDYRCATIPVIQGLSARPTNETPIRGTSVNE